MAETCRWDKYVSKLQITGNPLTLAFHAYDNLLVVGNDTDMIRFVCKIFIEQSLPYSFGFLAYGTGRERSALTISAMAILEAHVLPHSRLSTRMSAELS